MSAEVVILVGSPGVGKSWVSDQLKHSFEVIEQDDYIKNEHGYITEIARAAKAGTHPILANTPFGLSKIMEALENKNLKVRPIFIIEPPEVISSRYEQREGKKIPPGHITRQATYKQRARELGAFAGTSEQVLRHLKG